MNRLIMIMGVLSALLAPACVFAQTTAPTSSKFQFGPDQKLMLEAAADVVKRDFKDAEDLYNQAIAINGGNLDAYLQRGVVRHELGNAAGTASDGKMVVILTNTALKTNPRDPNLYYKRGMGFRLLGNYEQAKQDLTTGMQLGGPAAWQTDINAIEFEKKESK